MVKKKRFILYGQKQFHGLFQTKHWKEAVANTYFIIGESLLPFTLL
ncbi:hypothetical protein B4088_4682 [Bacillus cereus]|uniref:Uncharacterized protein n=1 Tax=Bacillus cereus TaxID=1396 RepID=A0A164LUZ1_BACCE|nr:hypothetical protein B4088_4682 [Bacillus cereus]